MKEIQGVFVINEELSKIELEQHCKEYRSKYNCKPIVIISKKRLGDMLEDDSKGYKLKTEEDDYKVPTIIDMEDYLIVETKDDNKYIYIAKGFNLDK